MSGRVVICPNQSVSTTSAQFTFSKKGKNLLFAIDLRLFANNIAVVLCRIQNFESQSFL